MKKVIVAVVSGGDAKYIPLLHASQETWDSTNVDEVPVFYYVNRIDPVPPRTLCYPDLADSLHNIGRKNLRAYRWSLGQEWDYMARINASCYVNKANLLKYVQDLRETGLFRGLMTGLEHEKGSFMWGGGQFIMSRDVVKAMVDSESQWNHEVMEDVAMTEMARTIKAPIDSTGKVCSVNRDHEKKQWLILSYNGANPSFYCDDLAEMKEKAGDHHFFRIKQEGNGRPADDIAVMRRLKEIGL